MIKISRLWLFDRNYRTISLSEDDEYQVQNEDEEDDERTIEEEEQLNSDDEQNELDELQAVITFRFVSSADRSAIVPSR